MTVWQAQDGEGWQAFEFTSADGLRLFCRDYGDRRHAALPVLCLPGLTRSARDFHDLALALSRDPDHPRRVLSFEYRGRGRSAHDPDPANYNPVTEANDVLAGMTAAGIEKAAVVGTSRGGILAMIVAVLRPGALGAVVLNDIGPEIDITGLLRIKGYVGKMATPRSFAEAASILKLAQGKSFPALSDDDWMAFARATFRDEGGAPAIDYDPALMATVAEVSADAPPPSLWPQFEALKDLPVMVIRGEYSDILAADTVARMAAAHPGLVGREVAGQGHAPLLTDPVLNREIGDFIAAAEAKTAG
ncbi:MAG: alpha/beta hydrolase [Hyphomicrobiales bacterium]